MVQLGRTSFNPPFSVAPRFSQVRKPSPVIDLKRLNESF
jgi:hypothetical protein